MGPRAHPFESVIRTSSTAEVLRPEPAPHAKNLIAVTDEGVFTQPQTS